MMRPAEWNEALAKGHREASKAVVEQARAWLDHCALAEGDMIESKTLIEYLYPEQFARGTGIDLRRSMFRHLRRAATAELRDYASKGEPRKMKFRSDTVSLWLWHPKRASAKRCDKCGQELRA